MEHCRACIFFWGCFLLNIPSCEKMVKKMKLMMDWDPHVGINNPNVLLCLFVYRRWSQFRGTERGSQARSDLPFYGSISATCLITFASNNYYRTKTLGMPRPSFQNYDIRHGGGCLFDFLGRFCIKHRHRYINGRVNKGVWKGKKGKRRRKKKKKNPP